MEAEGRRRQDWRSALGTERRHVLGAAGREHFKKGGVGNGSECRGTKGSGAHMRTEKMLLVGFGN